MGGKPVQILQFTDAASVTGQSVDANAFRGNDDELRGVRHQPSCGCIPPPVTFAVEPCLYLHDYRRSTEAGYDRTVGHSVHRHVGQSA